MFYKNICAFGLSTFIYLSGFTQINLVSKIKTTPIQNQSLSGTCWSFASLSFLESELIRTNIGTIKLSEMFVARHAYLLKIKEHLKQKGGNYFTSGGQFQDVAKVINQYGIVPKEAYSGLPNNETYYDHGVLDTLIITLVRQLVAQNDTILSTQNEAYINHLLDSCMGILPAEFIYKNKTYTPISFAKDYCKLNMDNYVSVTAYKHHALNKPIILEDKYNWSKSTYYNVSYANFLTITNNALKNKYSVLWDGDVTEEEFQFENGLATLPTKKANCEALRNSSFLNGDSKIDHVMHIVGIGIDKKSNRFYYVKNSWGNENIYNGFLYMNEAYFSIKTIAIVVHKNMIK
jgi:bleomycin hydrolase